MPLRFSVSLLGRYHGVRALATTLAPKIPSMQKAILFEKQNGPLLYKDIPVPKPKPNELLINVKYSGVCHLDLLAWLGHWPIPTKAELTGTYLVGGHEGTGIVVGMGKDVQGWKIGDQAGVKFVSGPCWQCEYCQEGHEYNCDNREMLGYTIDGSFQQYATVDAFGAPKIPEGMDLAKVAPILCAGITVYRALKTTTAIAGDWVAISGCSGGLGLLAVQYAKAMGFRVIGIDGGADKKAAALKGGVEVFLDFTEEDNIVKRVVEITGNGVKGVVNVSTSAQAIQQSVQYVKKRGVVVLVGLPPNATITASILQTCSKCVRIEGSFVGNRRDTDEAIDFMRRGLINYPIQIAGLSEVPRIFEEMQKGLIVGRYVVDTSK